MTFDWLSFLRLAITLSAQAKTSSEAEALRRSAISRAYYAAFHTAALCAQKKDSEILQQGGGDHYRVINYYRKHNRTDYRKLGDKLKRLYEDRLRADYDREFVDAEPVCRDALDIAQDAIAEISNICN